MNQTAELANSDLQKLSAEEIATQVERDIKRLARRWKLEHPKNKNSLRTAATEAAALYLQRHHDLYFRPDAQVMRDAHQHWMDLMREWFILTVEKAK